MAPPISGGSRESKEAQGVLAVWALPFEPDSVNKSPAAPSR